MILNYPANVTCNERLAKFNLLLLEYCPTPETTYLSFCAILSHSRVLHYLRYSL